MKKGCAFLVAVFLFFACSQLCQAGGKMVVSGISVTDLNYVIFASSYIGDNVQECAATDGWWPTGTQYAFWFPKDGNDVLYTQFLTAYLSGIPVWVHVNILQTLSFGNGVPCRINIPYGITMGRH